MQSDRPPSDSSYQRDPRSVPPKRISHYSNQGKRKQSTESGGPKSKRKEVDDEDSDVEYYNFEKLKKFHIPRKKGKEEKELLTDLLLSAREFTHTIYPTLRSSFFDAQSSRKIVINQAELVQNQRLEKEYLAKKKDLKEDGRSEKDLADSFGYLHFFKRSEVEKVCKDGLNIGHCNVASLGKPEMGVYVCKHADIVRFSKWEDQQSGYIVMFKIMKGKTKVVTEGRTPVTAQEPTPLYDCHITKIPIDVAQSIHSRAYLAFQYYLYEYGDVAVEERPRQVLPYAVLKYTYEDTPGSGIPGSRTSRRESSLEDVVAEISSLTSVAITADCGFCHWRGKLLVKNGTFCSVEIRSHLDTVFNVANIDRTINIKQCLSLDKLKRQLPPTLMSRSAKKYNVIYRGRTYNTFTLHPTEEGSGLGKFRQLVSHLVQRSTAAFIPLRNNSSLYLLPLSELTEEMGLRSSSPEPTTPDSTKQSQRAWKNFLHAIIITPKALSSKINDQRVFNIIHPRKRKDAPSTTPASSVCDALEQKLRQMNIDPSSALSAMEPEQHQKIYDRLKDKKKLLTSEKMLHSHYKDVDVLSPSLKATHIKSVATRWTAVSKLQQELYSAKKKLKVIQSPTNMRQRSLSKSSTENVADVSMEDTTEATFSDDEDAASKPPASYKIPKKPRIEDPVKVPNLSNVLFDTGAPVLPRIVAGDPRTDPSKKPKVPIPYTPAPKPAMKLNLPSGTTSSILRPAFKPLEELIFSGNLEELLKHPEFSFTEKHCSTHRVSGFAQPFSIDTPYIPWDENQPQISVTFSQILPYPLQNADCPFAYDNDPVVLSMLRAIHGDYDSSDDTAEDHEKVQWVRKILHNRESPTENGNGAEPYVPGETSTMARKIVEHDPEKSSPQFTEASPHQSSTDSGFVSSSTPGNIAIPDSPSLKDIAAIIASALTQTKSAASETPPKEAIPPPVKQNDSTPEMELAAKALLEALTQPPGSDSEDNDNFDGVDMEIGSTPEQSPMRERSHSKDPDSSLDTPRQEKEKGSKPPAAPTPGASSSQHPQGLGVVGTDQSLHPPFRHPSRPPKVKIPRVEATLTALRKVIPGLTKEMLEGVLTRVAPAVTKMLAMMKKKKETVGIKMGTPVPASTLKTQTGTARTKPPIESSNLSEMRKMTITLTTGQSVSPAGAGVAKITTETTYIPGLDIVHDQNTENQPTNETSTKDPIKDIPQPEMEAGTSKTVEKLISPGSGGQDCSATSPLLTEIKNTMQTKSSPGLPPLADNAPSSEIPQVSQTLTQNTEDTVTSNKLSNEEALTNSQSAIPIGTVISRRQKQYRSRPSDRGILTQVITTHPARGHCYPTQRSAPYSRSAPDTPAHLFPIPGYGRVGGSNPIQPKTTISEQNTDLLRTIISFMRPQNDPRLNPRKTQGANVYANILPGTIPPAIASNPYMSGQINKILQQLLVQPPVSATPPSQATVPPKPSPQEGVPQAHATLSQEDIQRIREKKEKLRKQRNAERELCRREAMYMREELNKSLERSKQKHQVKKAKPTALGKAKIPESPDSSNSSTSAGSSKNEKPQFSLSLPASEKVLNDVALALSDVKPTSSQPAPIVSNRPTGVVTPTPRPVHPVFMQSHNTFPLTEVTSSPQGPTTTSVETSTGPNPAQVISEIDTTLSQLKQEMQGSGSNDELKDSMAKLLQLVLKLGGASSSDQSSASEVETNVRAVTQPSSTTGEGDLRETLNAVSRSQPQSLASVTSVTQPRMVDSVVKETTSAFKWRLDRVPDNQLQALRSGTVLGQNEGISSRIAAETIRVKKEYEGQLNEDSVDDKPADASPRKNIDEILAKLKPYIEGFHQNDDEPEAKENVKPKGNKEIAETSSDQTTSEQGVSETVKKVVISKPHSKPEEFDVPAPTNFSSKPNAGIGIARPQPARPENPAVPIKVETSSKQPDDQSMSKIEVGTAGHSELGHSTSQIHILPAGNTARLHAHESSRVPASSPHSVSDRGTPTLDERYPEPVKSRKRKRRTSGSQSNSFVVFDPENSVECEAISRYLISVKGRKVDIPSMVKELLTRITEHGANPGVLEKEFRKVLPPGTLWVVFRTTDVKSLHSVPHLALLKAAGSHVQFVSADSVKDVRERRYKNLLTGDAGILIPLCPKTLLKNPSAFRHLMLWLLGQSDGGKVKNKWRLALHQHVLNAIQDAEDSGNDTERENADQVLEWLCHVGKSKSRFAIELAEHQCDKVDRTSGKTPNVWNWYDTATDEEIAAAVLPCAIKLQSDRVRQSRHIVLLIDGDPGALCWKPVWQSGACVTTLEKLVDLVCSKPSNPTLQQSTSCILPLYDKALQCL